MFCSTINIFSQVGSQLSFEVLNIENQLVVFELAFAKVVTIICVCNRASKQLYSYTVPSRLNGISIKWDFGSKTENKKSTLKMGFR